MSTQPIEIPAGYMRKANGDLTPTENVREADILRDSIVCELALAAKAISGDLKTFKTQCLNDIADLVRISAEKYGVGIGGKLGNVQLNSYDGRYRVERVQAKVISFTEELEAAKALVEQCILKWSDGADSRLRTIVMRAFKPNTKGELKTAAVVDLLKLEINDADWKMAMTALKDSLQTNGITTYVRIYERIGLTDKYQLINLDIAGVAA